MKSLSTGVVAMQGKGDLFISHFLKSRRTVLINAGLLILYYLAATAISFFYVGYERAFYFWDFAAYQDMALAKTIYWQELPLNSPSSILKAIKEVWFSAGREYSDLHTLLVTPFILLFGDSRRVYILALTWVYFIPFTLVSSAIAVKLLRANSQAVFWSAALLALLCPVAWLPTLRGYPDAGAAALIALAILIYLQDTQLKHWGQMVGIAICISGAILFRRHFVFSGIAFFAAAGLPAIIDSARLGTHNLRGIVRNLWDKGKRTALLAMITLGTLSVLGLPFIEQVLRLNFGSLYASYKVPAGIAFGHYQAYYGWISIFLAVVGFTSGIRARFLLRPAVSFILLFSIISILQWLFVVGQLGFHYTLHFSPAIILGVLIFGWVIWLAWQHWTKVIGIPLIIAFLVLNLILGLSPPAFYSSYSGTFAKIFHYPINLFSANHPPMVNPDYEEIVSLLAYLRQIAREDEPIYVAASSATLNDDLLWHANRTLYRSVFSHSYDEFWKSKPLNILQWVPFVDSRDEYPLEKLLQSQFVVVATPFQYHLAPNEQDLVRVVVDIFVNEWAFAKDFSLLPEEFSLSGISVNIYQRTRPTSPETAIRTLREIQDFVGSAPGERRSWINLGNRVEYYIEENADSSYNIDINLNSVETEPELAFLYILPLPESALVSGQSADYGYQCATITSSLQAISFHEHTAGLVDQKPVMDQDTEFSIPIRAGQPSYLILRLVVRTLQTESRDCWFSILNLKVQSDS